MVFWVFFFCILAQAWKMWPSFTEIWSSILPHFLETLVEHVDHFFHIQVAGCLFSAFFKKGCCGKTCELWVLYGFFVCKTTTFGTGKVLGKTCRSQVRFGSWAKHAPAAPWNTPPEMAEPSGIDSISYTTFRGEKKKQVPSRHGMAWCSMCFWEIATCTLTVSRLDSLANCSLQAWENTGFTTGSFINLWVVLKLEKDAPF